MDKPSESSGTKPRTARLEVSRASTVSNSEEQFQRPVHVVTEDDYSLPILAKEKIYRPDSSVPNVSMSRQLQEHDTDESGHRYVKAIRRVKSINPVRRDSSSSSSSSSSNESGSSSSSNADNSNGSGGGGGGGSSSSSNGGGDRSNGSGSNGSNCGGSSTTSSSSSSTTSWVTVDDSSHEASCVDANVTDTKFRQLGGQSNTEIDALIPSEVQSHSVPSHGQQENTAVPLDEKTTVICKVRRLSDSTSSSCSSNRSKSGDRRAVKGHHNNKFPDYSPGLNDAFTKAIDPMQETQREDKTWDVIRECIEAIDSRVRYLRSLAETALGDDYVPYDPLGKSDVDTSTSDLAVSTGSSNYEKRFEAVEVCLLDAYVDIASEEDKVSETSDPIPSRRQIGERMRKEFIRETIKFDAEEFRLETTSSDECKDIRNTVQGKQRRGQSASGYKQEGADTMECDEQSSYQKGVLQALKSASLAVERAVRNRSILTMVAKTAEKYVEEIKVNYGIILSCINCMINVVRPTLEANRLVQTAQRKAAPLDSGRTDALLNSATIASRFTQTTLSYAEDAVRCHTDAIGALSGAETSLEEIRVDESTSDDYVLEMYLCKDGLDMVVEEMSNIGLEDLRHKTDLVKHKAGSVEMVVRATERESACIEELFRNSHSARLELLASLACATGSSVKALEAAANVLETLSAPNDVTTPEEN